MFVRIAAAAILAASLAVGAGASAQTASPSARHSAAGRPSPRPSGRARPANYPVINIDSKTMQRLLRTPTPAPRAPNKIMRKIEGVPSPTVFKSIGN